MNLSASCFRFLTSKICSLAMSTQLKGHSCGYSTGRNDMKAQIFWLWKKARQKRICFALFPSLASSWIPLRNSAHQPPKTRQKSREIRGYLFFVVKWPNISHGFGEFLFVGLISPTLARGQKGWWRCMPLMRSCETKSTSPPLPASEKLKPH